jgi:hypothetical protein
MGLAKSLRKINFGQNIADAVQGYLKKKDDEERQQKFLDSLNKLQSDISGMYNPTTELQATYPQSNIGTRLKDVVQKRTQNTPEISPQLSMGTNKGLSLRDLGQQPTFVEKQVPADINSANQKSVERTNQFLIEALRNKVNPELINTGLSLAERLRQSKQPVKPNRVTLGEGGKLYNENPLTGELTLAAENEKDFQTKANPDKELDTFTGQDGQRYTIFQKPDGNTYARNVITGEAAPPDLKVKDNNDGVSTALQALIYRMEQDAQDREKKERTAQAKYNAKMGIPWYSVEDLIKQGELDKYDYKNEDGTYKIGGAYKDPETGKLLFSDEEVQALANTKAADAPNKWTRNKKTQKTEVKTNPQSFEEGKIYVDANGNKAIYKNGKWEEVK